MLQPEAVRRRRDPRAATLGPLDEEGISGPERLMVSESVEEGAPAAHRDRMLVRLTSYQP